jgi:nucleoside-diphosphate-sugar epimerase
VKTKRVFITGVNGFIGSNLAVHLKSRGFDVNGSSRGEAVKRELADVVSSYSPLHLNQEFDKTVFKGMDAVVHLAHSFKGRDNVRCNVEGSQKWFGAAKSRGVKTQVFLTSFSAKSDSGSEYAEIKYELETFFVKEKQPVVRPGLVLGAGGLFGRMLQMVEKFPLMPVLNGGRQRVPIISIKTLVNVIGRIIEEPQPTIYNLFQEEMVSLVDMLKEMRRQLHKRCLLLPIPSFLPLVFLKTVELLRIPFPLHSSSITALKENQKLKRPSSLPGLKLEDLSLPQIIQDIISGKH